MSSLRRIEAAGERGRRMAPRLVAAPASWSEWNPFGEYAFVGIPDDDDLDDLGGWRGSVQEFVDDLGKSVAVAVFEVSRFPVEIVVFTPTRDEDEDEA